MKLLLAAINAKYIHSNLAVRSLAACAPDCADHLILKEYTINHTPDFILQELYKAAPDVLFLSCYIWNVTYAETITAELHKLLPQLPVWLGGPEVSFESQAFLAAHPAVTGIMRGEGEDSFPALARHYVYGSPETPADIPGLVYRHNGTIAETGEALRLPLSDIPFAYASPAMHTTEPQSHRRFSPDMPKQQTDSKPSPDTPKPPVCSSPSPNAPTMPDTCSFSGFHDMSALEHRIVYYESSRGCPFCCTYCLSSLEKSLRFRDLELVKKELSFFVGRIPQVKFVDRTFNCNHAHALAIWRHIREIDRGTTNFHFEISADLFSGEALALLQTFRPGLIQLEIGVQSTNPATLAAIRRQTDLPRLMSNVRRIRSWNNMHLHLDLIAGLPFEDYDTFAKSFDDVFALIPNQLQLGFLKVLKGSYLYEHAQEYGILCHERPPYEVLATKWLNYGDLLCIKRVEEMVEVYYNSAQYALTIRLLTLLCQSAFAFFQRLGDYYERNGLFGRSHSRLARCEILLDFLREEAMRTTATDKNRSNEAQSKAMPGPTFVHEAPRPMLTVAATHPLPADRTPCLSLANTASAPVLTHELLDLLREALVYDLYARENCKKRPDWAADFTPHRDQLRALSTEPKSNLRHTEIFHYRFPLTDAQALASVPEKSAQPLFYRFCYDRRDPLSYQAYIEVLQPRKPGEED